MGDNRDYYLRKMEGRGNKCVPHPSKEMPLSELLASQHEMVMSRSGDPDVPDRIVVFPRIYNVFYT